MHKSSLKELDYFIAWIVFFFAALIGGAIAGFIGGAVIGGILGVMGASLNVIRVAGAIVGFILGLPVSYLCFRLSVAKLIVPKIQFTPEVIPSGAPYATNAPNVVVPNQ
jgi:hypothetical protein